MSDEEHQDTALLMLAATKVINPGPARISKIGFGIVLPRAIEIRQLAAGFIGALVLFIPSLIFVGEVRSMMFAIGIGASLGLLAVTWSPLRNESLATWLGLEVASRTRRNGAVTPDGRPARAYVGVAPLPRLAVGPARIVAGAVDVPPGSVNERGLPVKDFESAPQQVTPVHRKPVPFPVMPGSELPRGEIRPMRTRAASQHGPTVADTQTGPTHIQSDPHTAPQSPPASQPNGTALPPLRPPTAAPSRDSNPTPLQGQRPYPPPAQQPQQRPASPASAQTRQQRPVRPPHSPPPSPGHSAPPSTAAPTAPSAPVPPGAEGHTAAKAGPALPPRRPGRP